METSEIAKELRAMYERKWYDFPFIRFEIIKQLQHKYLNYMFLNEKTKKWELRRYFFGYSWDMLNNAFNKIGNIYSMRFYNNLAYYESMQHFSWDVHKRKDQKDVWKEEKQEQITGFDFAFDFDAPKPEQWKKAWIDCKKAVDFLIEQGSPISIIFSGTKGFHIRINDKYINLKDPDKKVIANHKLAQYLKAKLKLKTIDTGIYDADRIIKLAYTIDGKSGLVVLPLTRHQFENFDINMCEPETVLQNVQIKNRGLPEAPYEKEKFDKLIRSIK